MADGGLLDTAPGSTGGNLLQFIQGLPNALSGNPTPPPIDPALQQMLSPDQLAVANANYQRNFIANQGQLAANGTRWQALNGDAQQAASGQYLGDIQKSIADAAMLRQFRNSQQALAARDRYVAMLRSQGTPQAQQQANAISMADPNDPRLMEQIFKNEFPSRIPKQVITQMLGDGRVAVLDASSGALIHIIGDKTKELGGAGAGTLLDPDTLQLAATDVAANPTHMANYVRGRGQAAQPLANQINAQISANLKNAGMSPADLSGIRASVNAQASSLKGMTTMQNNLQAFEAVARNNGQRILDLLQNVPDSGSPMINSVLRGAAVHGLGDADATELRAVMTNFQAEAARIINDPAMKGVVSDTARGEIQNMASGNMSLAAGKRVINRLFTEFDVRNAALTAQMQRAQYMTGFHGGDGTTAPAGAAGVGAAPPGAPPVNPMAQPVQPGVRKYNLASGALEH